ncbi:peptidase M13 [Philodulcilactobacillus myokoensis]|uniref:Peptidase M13 n=1 Tax=Philodulcilactobacillus myokoensis TaxID=2929573 RepID=A0A9W6B019_9LACO|nr:M13-type metalloendopeptidase [Philodulcilactobacillus myokoensis]GLB46519.1 peptidase M13 [Philodulcilactobacillus myokoensis]
MDKTNEINESLVKDDLYQAVNGNWLKTAKIPADHSSTGGFMDLVDQIEKTLIHDSNDLKNGKIAPKNKEMAEYKKFYTMTTNFKKREADGSKPLMPLLKKVQDLKSLSDLNHQLRDWILDGFPLPFALYIEADEKNTKLNALYATAPSLFMPDKTYYSKNNQSYQKLMPILVKMLNQLLVMVGYSKEQAQTIVAKAKAYDQLIAPHVKSAEESADEKKNYNPQKFSDLDDAVPGLDLAKVVTDLIGQNETPKRVINNQPKYYEALKDLLSPDHFDEMKAWMLVGVLTSYTGDLSEEFRQAGSLFSRALSGKKQTSSKEKAAYYLAEDAFDQVVGDYYGHKYFGEKAKADVHQMVVNMINVYKKRLTDNDWLSDSTRKQAINKLNHLGIQVGYPDKIDPLFAKFHVETFEDGASIVSNEVKFTRIAVQDIFSKWNRPVDRMRWEMPANMVNAYYHPFKNIIVFPAAILQKPFYSLDQSSSENYGGIGAVMAHEISHSFDNNGSLFDEYGNLHNWWTKEDHEHFEKLTDQMIKEFDGMPFAGGKVNGKLTVSENIADDGGLSCAEEAAKSENNVDLRAFFFNWARVWRTKSTEAFKQLLLSIDVHAPSELRGQIQPQNLDDFFKTFDIKPGDGMYRKPADRVKIW